MHQGDDGRPEACWPRTLKDDLKQLWHYHYRGAALSFWKAWFALLLPEGGRWASKHAAEKRAIETIYSLHWRKPSPAMSQRRA